MDVLDAGDQETYFSGSQLVTEFAFGGKHTHLIHLVLFFGRHQFNLVTLANCAVDHADQ